MHTTSVLYVNGNVICIVRWDVMDRGYIWWFDLSDRNITKIPRKCGETFELVVGYYVLSFFSPWGRHKALALECYIPEDLAFNLWPFKNLDIICDSSFFISLLLPVESELKHWRGTAIFCKSTSWLTVSCLGSTMHERFPKGTAWQDTDTPVTAQNSGVIHKLKPIKHCKTSWTWSLERTVMGKSSHCRHTMLQKSLWCANPGTCCSLFFFSSLTMCSMSLLCVYMQPHYQENLFGGMAPPLLAWQRHVQTDLWLPLIACYRACVLLWCFSLPLLWRLGLIKRKSEHVLCAAWFDMYQVAPARSSSPSAPLHLLCKKKEAEN